MQPIYLIYTGGTFGMYYQDPENKKSPLVPQNFATLIPKLKNFKQIPNSKATSSPYLNKNQYHTLEYQKLKIDCVSLKRALDSSQISPIDWIALAKLIHNQADNYSGFIIIHGTDTMAYTASSLSFMLQSLGKPIFLVGSQTPLLFKNSDALPNLTLAIDNLLSGKIKQNVWIAYNKKITLGNCSTKMGSSLGFPNLKTKVKPDTINQLKPNYTSNIKIADGVQVVFFTPTCDNSHWAPVLKNSDIHSVVFMSYGSGNAKIDEELTLLVKQALDNKKIIANLSQTPAGKSDKAVYACSLSAIDDRIIDLKSMTIESAVTKLMWAKANLNFKLIKQFMENNQVGELS